MKSLTASNRALAALFFTIGWCARAPADVVHEWNDALRRFVTERASTIPSVIQARAFVMMHLAIDSAITAATEATRPGDARLALQRGAAAIAASDVLEHVLPAGTGAFEALAKQHLSALGTHDETQARRIGHLAAAQTIQQRERDGWAAFATFNPVVPSPDGSNAAAEAAARGEKPPVSPWRSLLPFALKKVDQFEPITVFTVTHQGIVIVNQELRDARLFKSIDGSATVDAMRTAWSADPIITWNRVARVAMESAAFDIEREARMFAVLNLALSDALLAAEHWRFSLGTWSAKTVDVFEEMYGKAPFVGDHVVQVSDGHDLRSVRLETGRMLIPPQRDFPSVAATLAGAAQAALSGAWKTDHVPFSVSLASRVATAVGHTERHYLTFSDAAREAAFVASLDGRHCREACVSGYKLGAAIGVYVTKRTLAPRR